MDNIYPLSFQHIIKMINDIVYIFFFIVSLPKPVCVLNLKHIPIWTITSPLLSKPHNHKEKLWKDFPTALLYLVGHFWGTI